MTLTAHTNDGTYDIYKVTIPANVVGVIFSGTNPEGQDQQTSNIDIATANSGDIYYMSYKANSDINIGSVPYVEGTKTIYFQNNWLWTDVKLNYLSNNISLNTYTQQGTYKTYTVTIPNFVTEFTIDGVKNNSTSREGTLSLALSSITNGTTYSMKYDGANRFVESIKLYLKPNSNWTSSNAWFTARIWNNDGDAWFKMNSDGSGYYYCYVPQNYSNVIFCRMDSSASSTSISSYTWDYVWNQTSDLTFSASSNCYTIASGAWSKGSGTWSTK